MFADGRKRTAIVFRLKKAIAINKTLQWGPMADLLKEKV